MGLVKLLLLFRSKGRSATLATKYYIGATGPVTSGATLGGKYIGATLATK